MNPPPDFIIGGPPKSGTTSLYRYMDTHPQICMSPVKEPMYFASPASHRFGTLGGLRRRRRRSWYDGLFADCPEGSIRGEGSTAYFYLPESARMIRDEAPHAKLIFILRDPVERTYSHYFSDLKARRLPPFEQIADGDHPRFRHFVAVSRYSEHLTRFYDVFPREQVLVLLMDDLRDDPIRALQSAFAFVGADSTFEPPGVEIVHNVATRPRSRVARFVFGQRPMPHPALNRYWRPLARTVERLNTVTIDATVPDGVRSRLLPLFSDDIERLEAMLGRPLDAWKVSPRSG